jgi:hypothetical protein
MDKSPAAMNNLIVLLAFVVFMPPFSGLVLGQEKEGSAAAAPAKSAQRAPAYDPPEIVVAAAIDDEDNLVLVNYRTIFIGFQGESYNDRSLTKAPLKDVAIFTVKGEKLTVEAARRRIAGRDTPVLCSAWSTPLPGFYAAMFSPETLHFVFPKEPPIWKKIQEPGRPIQ